MDIAINDDTELLLIIAGTSSTFSSEHHVNEAIGELYDRYGRLVYSIAIHTVGDPETAEEITQDVFVRACAGARTYRPEKAKVSSWLVSIARHRSIDELRRRRVRPEKGQVDWPVDFDSSKVNALLATEGPEAEVEGTMQQRVLHQIIAALPHEQRQVLGLAYFQGLSHSEIASLLGEPLGTVKSRIRIGMQKVRDTLIEQGMTET